MPWEPIVSDGAAIFLDIGASWEEIRGARNWSVGAPTKEKIDRTELRDSVKKEIGGKVTFGDATFTFMFDPRDTTHLLIETQANTAGSSDRIYIKYPGISQYVLYAGSFGGLAESMATGSIIEAPVTFTMSAAPVRSTSVPAA